MPNTKKNLKSDFDKLIIQLENKILGGGFQPRERLPELKLAEELKVSRFWIRDALKVLENKGLIKMIPYKGAIVCDLDETEIEEIFETRIYLEALAARKAAMNIKQEDIAYLEKMADQFEESMHSGDFSDMINTNTSFHDTILNLCGNRVMIQIIKQLQARCHLLRYHAWSSSEVLTNITREHRLFISALQNKRYDMLNDLSKRHISYSKTSYLIHLRAKRVNMYDNEDLE